MLVKLYCIYINTAVNNKVTRTTVLYSAVITAFITLLNYYYITSSFTTLKQFSFESNESIFYSIKLSASTQQVGINELNSRIILLI